MTQYVYLANRVLDRNGIADSSSIFFYLSGTTTLIDIYSDPDYTIQLPNPLRMVMGAAVPPVYWQEGSVRVVVIDSSGEIVSDDDPYSPFGVEALSEALAEDTGAQAIGIRQDGAGAIRETVAATVKRTGAWIEQFGAVPNDPLIDNRDAILAALYSGAKLVCMGEGIFYSSPIFVGRQADGVRFQGKGYSSTLALLGNYSGGVGNQRALLSIPAGGDPFGGTFDGAHDFFVDQIRFYGGDATGDNSTSTVGFAAFSPQGGGFGTIWTHGFTKHGVLLAGTPSSFSGRTLYTFDNGNRAGLTTSAQGIGIACAAITDPSIIVFGDIITWDNGIANQGFGIDFSSGSVTVGSVSSHGNGICCFKVAGPSTQEVIIGHVTSVNDHGNISGATAAIWSNGDFGLLQIGSVVIRGNRKGGGMGFAHSGRVIVGSIYIDDVTGAGFACGGGAGKTFYADVGSIIVKNSGGIGVSCVSGAHISARFGSIYAENCTNFGVYITCQNFSATSIDTVNCGTTYAVQVAGTPQAVYIGSVRATRDTMAATRAMIITTGITNVTVGAASVVNYPNTISDQGTGNNLPVKILRASITQDVASIAAGGRDTFDVSATGAALGDIVNVSCSNVLNGIILTGWVQAADTVRVQLFNPTTAAIDPFNSSYRVVVQSPVT